MRGQGQGDTEFVFGYKLHLLADANYGIPLSYQITPANVNDSPTLPPLLKQAKKDFRSGSIRVSCWPTEATIPAQTITRLWSRTRSHSFTSASQRPTTGCTAAYTQKRARQPA